MSTQHPYPVPGAPQPQQSPPPQPKKTPRWLIVTLIATGLVALLFLGSCIAGAIGIAGLASESSTPIGDSSIEASSGETSQAPNSTTTKPTAPYRSKANIDKSDIKLHVKVLSKKCYGYGIGCNVTYRVKVDGAYMDDWPKSGEVEVSYRVTGLEDGPEDDSFMITLDDGQYEKPWEASSSTRSRGTKLSVRVTDVEFSK